MPQHAKEMSLRDPLWAGCSLLIATLLMVGACSFVANLFVDNGLDNSTSSEDDLESIHDIIKENKSSLLICVACLWLSAPFYLTHAYCFKLICESLFVTLVKTNKVNSSVYYMKWLYIMSFTLFVILIPCMIGIVVFLGSYFSWNFADTDGDASYTGYYIQFMVFCAIIPCYQCGTLWMCITAIIPWILLLFTDMKLVSSNNICCFSFMLADVCNKILIEVLMVIFIIGIVLATLISSFDWADSGFWADDGISAEIDFILIVSHFIVAVWLIFLSCRINGINSIVKNTNENK